MDIEMTADEAIQAMDLVTKGQKRSDSIIVNCDSVNERDGVSGIASRLLSEGFVKKVAAGSLLPADLRVFITFK